jgi:hypothetical protein
MRALRSRSFQSTRTQMRPMRRRPYTISIASPKLKNRYPRASAVR